MISRVIRFSAEHRGVVLALTVVLLALAWQAVRTIPLDALPDLSDTQVIVVTRWDRSADQLEDQVTYPLVTALLGTPGVKTVRGVSDFGSSFVYVIFEDGTESGWARSRVLEALSQVQGQLPEGARPALGPDASGVGWVFQYALVDRSGRVGRDGLRSTQDWFVKLALQAVPGVAEVATVGGALRQYQVEVNPTALAARGLSMRDVVVAVRASNAEVGGRLVELSGREAMVRGRGYVRSPEDLEAVVLRAEHGTPITLRDVATVSLGPALERGLADLDGEGDVVGGIVVMRAGQNALDVIERVKARLAELEPRLPEGVELVTTYDRSLLIGRAIDTVSHKLLEELLIVALVILVFLWHFPSSLVPIATIPISVALSFIPMKLMGLEANLMSLAGIAISIGVLVDGAIIEVENAYNRTRRWLEAGRPGDFHEVRLRALMEVGPSVFFSLLIIAVAFLPVFTLVDQEGRLFRPLAASKTLAMAIAALLAVTLDPALRMLFARVDPFTFRPRWLARVATALLVGRYRDEAQHPVSRLLHRLYEGPCRFTLRHPRAVVLAALAVVLASLPLAARLGSEFMPPLREGTVLAMPSAVQPGLTVSDARRALTLQDELLRQVPEVARVFGKAGRADTATDPAPLTMFETVVELKPEREWRRVPRWYSSWAPAWLAAVLRPFWSDRLSWEDLERDLDARVRLPGMANAWTMPIKARLDMLATGLRTPVGVKVLGDDLEVVERTALAVEAALEPLPGTRSVVAERVASGTYLDFELERAQLARYGLTVDDANALVTTAIGGDVQSVTIEGRARYGVTVRLQRDYRQDPTALEALLVTLPDGARVPLGSVARLRLTTGPSMLRDEDGLLASYVAVDLDGSKVDLGGYVAKAREVVAAQVSVPPGVSLVWSGQFENLQRMEARLRVVVPLTLVLIFVLLSLSTRSGAHALLVMLAVPFSAVGALLLLNGLGYHLSMAVWVGLIALLGLDAETGVFMLLFLDLSVREARERGALQSRADLIEAIVHGAVKRVRPKAMTVTAAALGLLPIMWSTGTGADVMKRIAAPMVGGLATSFLLELLVYPAAYLLLEQRQLTRAPQAAGSVASG